MVEKINCDLTREELIEFLKTFPEHNRKIYPAKSMKQDNFTHCYIHEEVEPDFITFLQQNGKGFSYVDVQD